MARVIKFEKRSNVIPIDFGDFQLEFVANDDNLSRLDKLQKELSKESKRLESITTEENVSETLEALKFMATKAWDESFGEGTFDKIYQFAGQSVTMVINYFVQTFEGISEEYHEQINADKLKKYIED
ncbi:hypothetical protein D3H64_06040 [Atopobacter sp. AH10]|uniref:hypothetical protein n=1 Tax=Atopobacter sp. AH10 TaxID=2315861 RepID=UPI000EF17C7B|nr:hypothetical protein [Atopobacter sp. AH10]RLK63152.1 hypothetical protein D3H64_06040 [Atopobacter sp. AH10]